MHTLSSPLVEGAGGIRRSSSQPIADDNGPTFPQILPICRTGDFHR